VGGGSGMGAAVSPVHVWCISVVVVKRNCVRDFRWLGLCTVGTVG
jgi:hypothetical protein